MRLLAVLAIVSLASVADGWSIGLRSRALLWQPLLPHAPRPRRETSMAVEDPFRAGKKAPIEPAAINALARALKLPPGVDVLRIADDELSKRAEDPEEERLLRSWVAGTLERRESYLETLRQLATSEPWFEGELGVGSDENPYVMLCRAECMLALYLLRDAGADARREVSFIDADRLDVLKQSC
jgi:hypothetical protein